MFFPSAVAQQLRCQTHAVTTRIAKSKVQYDFVCGRAAECRNPLLVYVYRKSYVYIIAVKDSSALLVALLDVSLLQYTTNSWSL